MSMFPTSGILGSVAGTAFSQTKGAEAERSTREVSDKSRSTEHAQQAENASGIGVTEQDQGTQDRDADGRMFWEVQEKTNPKENETKSPSEVLSKDATGNSGNSLDLVG